MTSTDRPPEEKFALVSGLRNDLKTAIEAIANAAAPSTVVGEAFRFWCMGIGVLVHEYLGTALSLLESERSRIALIIPRFIMEAHMRLELLLRDAERIRAAGEDLETAEVVRSWRSFPQRLDLIRERLIGAVASLTDEEREAYMAALAESEMSRNLRLPELLSVYDPQDRSAVLGEYDLESAYVHLNEFAVAEAIRGNSPEEISLNWSSHVISRDRILGLLARHTHDLLTMIALITGSRELRARLRERLTEFRRVFA